MDQVIVTVATLVLLLASVLVVHFARREAAAIRKSTSEEAQDIREEARDLLSEAQRREERVAQREKDFAADQRAAQLYSRALDERAAVIARDEKRLHAELQEANRIREERLAEVAQMSLEEARATLIESQVAAAEAAAQTAVRRIEREVEATAKERAREILVTAMESQAAAVSSDSSVTRIDLPNEEMKGRIIGKEGRNIRVFEALTGVNVLVDDGSDAVLLSSFDVERREIADVTLRALIDDGRIQPQRIEATYARTIAETEQRHLHAGLDAMEAAGVTGVPQEVVEMFGRLRLRTSYGQNVLAHLVESARIAASIATELGADVDLARRSAFFHDLGKVFTPEREGTHAAIGAQIAAEHGEPDEVVNAIAAHHDEVPATTLEAVIVQIADSISAARPGARREDVDGYLARIESLERLVASYEGVANVVAMSAGREVRVVVEPQTVTDEGTRELARTIAGHINREFNFPGEIKVTVIRELRADAVAGQV